MIRPIFRFLVNTPEAGNSAAELWRKLYASLELQRATEGTDASRSKKAFDNVQSIVQP